MPGRNAGLGSNVSRSGCCRRRGTAATAGCPPASWSASATASGCTGPPRGAFDRLDAAATAAGPDLHVNSGYRTHAEQAALYQAYQNGTGNLAAAPGHSKHGLGLSADIQLTDPVTLSWLRAQAGTYGFVNDVPSEE